MNSLYTIKNPETFSTVLSNAYGFVISALALLLLVLPTAFGVVPAFLQASSIAVRLFVCI